MQQFQTQYRAYEHKCKRKLSFEPAAAIVPLGDYKQAFFTSNYEVSRIWLILNSAFVMIGVKNETKLKCIMFNHETIEELQGDVTIDYVEKRQEDYGEYSVLPQPYLDRSPESVFRSLTQFDGGIIYLCEKNIYRKSFNSDEVILIRNFESEVRDAFLISNDKLLVYSDMIELMNHKTRETLAYYAVNCDIIKSNKRMKDLFFISAFDKYTTFILCFTNDRRDECIIEPVYFAENIKLYELPYRNDDHLVIERRLTVEYAEMSRSTSNSLGYNKPRFLKLRKHRMMLREEDIALTFSVIDMKWSLKMHYIDAKDYRMIIEEVHTKSMFYLYDYFFDSAIFYQEQTLAFYSPSYF